MAIDHAAIRQIGTCPWSPCPQHPTWWLLRQDCSGYVAAAMLLLHSGLQSCTPLWLAARCRAALLALEEESLPLMMEAMWAANVLDMQHTLRKVRSWQWSSCGGPLWLRLV